MILFDWLVEGMIKAVKTNDANLVNRASDPLNHLPLSIGWF